MPPNAKIDQAFILAAGLGTRLRPYTDDRPKPLVPVGGRPIIDHVLDSLATAGVCETAINLHYRGAQIEEHLRGRKTPHLVFSHEEVLLETGGGIKKALPLLADKPFYTVSGDSFWTDDHGPGALARLAEAWDPARMDILLLLQPLARMTLTGGRGDYHLLPDGRAQRALDKSGTYMWTSVRVCAPGLFDGTPDGPFSFLQLLDRAESAGRLHAIVHEGDWHHISTPDDLLRIEAHLKAESGRQRA